MDDLQHQIKSSKPFAAIEEEAFLNLIRTTAYLKAQTDKLLKTHGISDPQYNVLRILAGAGDDGLPCAEIGNRMVTRVPDITRLIDRLSKSGLVDRKRSQSDRRVVNVRVTAEGRRIALELAPLLVDLHRNHLGHLSRADLQALNELLVKVRRSAED